MFECVDRIIYNSTVNHSSLRKKLFIDLLRLLYSSKCHHIGCCLSCMDILIQLFVYECKKDDVVELSKGHAAPALYVVLHYLKKITTYDLKTFCQDGTRLSMHPPYYHYRDVIPIPTGSLGHGLSISCGIAHAMFLKNPTKKNFPYVYCLMSDGECNEGQVWEAAQYASFHHLHNIIAFIDKNKFQGFGKTKEVMGDSASQGKWKAFGFNTYQINGHNSKEIHNAIIQAKKANNGKPSVIICETVKGYGVSYMENTLDWHYKKMNKQQFEKALDDVRKKL